jgi:hypothetical protein
MTTAISGTSGITFPDASIQSTAATGVVSSNRLINGAMAVSQRNGTASQTITAGAALAYTVDRWYAYSTGANVTGQQIAGTFASSQYLYQFTGAASVTAIGFGQRIEQLNSFDLANTTATLSCYISNSLLTTVTWTASYANTANTFGSLASPTVTQIATGTFTVSSTRTQYVTNISIPSAATTGIQIVFTVGAQTSGTWIVDSIQLEKGPSATSFGVRPYGTELMLCQRYYYRTPTVGVISTSGYATNTTVSALCVQYPVTLRDTPTALEQSGTASNYSIVTASSGSVTCTSVPTISTATSVQSMRVSIAVASGLTAGQFAELRTTAGYLGFSAEL